MAANLSNEAANRMVVGYSGFINEGATPPGKARFYTGAEPANSDLAATGTLLVEFDLNATSFAAPAAGVASANSIAGKAIAVTGTPGYCRIINGDGATVEDIPVGVGKPITFDNYNFVEAETAAITSLTFTQNKVAV
jgi:hypothetical protein